LFHHSSRVYYWSALAGKRRGLKFDRELLYAGAMFHDMGLTPAHCSADERFEVDGANTARDFLRKILRALIGPCRSRVAPLNFFV
jgi:HD superfamily phosphodiesterase